MHEIGGRVAIVVVGDSRGKFGKMKFYISTSGIKRVTISGSGGAGKGSLATATASRRISSRTMLPVVLVLAIALPFFFVRIAFLVLESAAACSSPLGNCPFFSMVLFFAQINLSIFCKHNKTGVEISF